MTDAGELKRRSVEVSEIIGRTKELMAVGKTQIDAMEQALRESGLLDGLFTGQALLNPRGVELLVKFGLLWSSERRRTLHQRLRARSRS